MSVIACKILELVLSSSVCMLPYVLLLFLLPFPPPPSPLPPPPSPDGSYTLMLDKTVAIGQVMVAHKHHLLLFRTGEHTLPLPSIHHPLFHYPLFITSSTTLYSSPTLPLPSIHHPLFHYPLFITHSSTTLYSSPTLLHVRSMYTSIVFPPAFTKENNYFYAIPLRHFYSDKIVLDSKASLSHYQIPCTKHCHLFCTAPLEGQFLRVAVASKTKVYMLAWKHPALSSSSGGVPLAPQVPTNPVESFIKHRVGGDVL